MEKGEKLVWIKRVVAKGKKFLVYINDETEGISFTEEQLISNRIIKGTSFYEKDWKKIIKSLDEGILFDKTLKYIDYKPRTEKEVIDYLEEHNATPNSIKNIVKIRFFIISPLINLPLLHRTVNPSPTILFFLIVAMELVFHWALRFKTLRALSVHFFNI